VNLTALAKAPTCKALYSLSNRFLISKLGDRLDSGESGISSISGWVDFLAPVTEVVVGVDAQLQSSFGFNAAALYNKFFIYEVFFKQIGRHFSTRLGSHCLVVHLQYNPLVVGSPFLGTAGLFKCC